MACSDPKKKRNFPRSYFLLVLKSENIKCILLLYPKSNEEVAIAQLLFLVSFIFVIVCGLCGRKRNCADFIVCLYM